MTRQQKAGYKAWATRRINKRIRREAALKAWETRRVNASK